jgi:hypothetical protein
MMDEAFISFQQIIERMLAFGGEIVDDEAGVRSHVTSYEIETPVELDVTRDEAGALQIGSTPPMYYVDTSLRPSFHRLRFTAKLTEAPHGD